MASSPPKLLMARIFAAIAMSVLAIGVKTAVAQTQPPPSFPPSGQSGPVGATTRPATITVPATKAKAATKAGATTRLSSPASAPPPKPNPLKPYLDQIENLREELSNARQQLAKSQLDAAQALRELEELRQFVQDHHQFGNDFQQYKAVKEVAEREAQQKEIQAAREKRDIEKADREARRRVMMADKSKRDAEAAQASRYRQAGFTAVGMDVFTSKMAFFYETKDVTRTRVDYSPYIGRYVRPSSPATEIDYSHMTISGSVMSGDGRIRNIGVAITFFDDNGNQVGHETVQINNARPDVPYPFTSKIDMALNRPFDSSSVYVLYADVVEGEGNAPAATTSTPSPAPTPQSGGSPGAPRDH